MAKAKEAKLQFKFNREEVRSLKAHGADHSIYTSSTKFELEEMCIPFKPDIYNVKSSMYNANKQYENFMKLMQQPIKGHPLIVLGSYPTDSRAKLLAANLMLHAVTHYRQMTPKQRRGKAQPMWHKLYGGFKDPLLDNGVKPSFLVISNITEESTSHKLEKLRDILEKHSDVPRVIVLGCKLDPVSFVAQRLYLSIKNAVFCGGQNIIRSILDD